MTAGKLPSADDLSRNWRESPRWRGITRGYQAADVVRLRGTIPVEHSRATTRFVISRSYVPLTSLTHNILHATILPRGVSPDSTQWMEGVVVSMLSVPLTC